SARAAYRTHAAQHLVQGDELGRVDLAACRVRGGAPTEVLAHLTDHSGGDVTDLGEGDPLCRQIEKSLERCDGGLGGTGHVRSGDDLPHEWPQALTVWVRRGAQPGAHALFTDPVQVAEPSVVRLGEEGAGEPFLGGAPSALAGADVSQGDRQLQSGGGLPSGP